VGAANAPNSRAWPGESRVAKRDSQPIRVDGLLRRSARLRRTAEDLAARARRLRDEIARETQGRVVERRKKPPLRGK
jgi:hypothetical protein